MAWQIRFEEKAQKQLKKLEKNIQIRILNKLNECAHLKDPRSAGKVLVGNLKGQCRYRVGSYRIICKLIDNQMIITVVSVGKRSNIYKIK